MNRYFSVGRSHVQAVPRRRGDEPIDGVVKNEATGLFPAGAGMNRITPDVGPHLYAVPRRRGDEPWYTCINREHIRTVPRRRGDEPIVMLRLVNQDFCSPQARG